MRLDIPPLVTVTLWDSPFTQHYRHRDTFSSMNLFETLNGFENIDRNYFFKPRFKDCNRTRRYIAPLVTKYCIWILELILLIDQDESLEQIILLLS